MSLDKRKECLMVIFLAGKQLGCEQSERFPAVATFDLCLGQQVEEIMEVKLFRLDMD